MLRITAYADRLEKDLDGLDWSEGIKLLQRNWIGRSTGAEVDCIIERDGWLHPIEIKLTSQPTRKQTLGLQAFRKAHPDLRIGSGLMLCAVEQARWISEDVLALPWNVV